MSLLTLLSSSILVEVYEYDMYHCTVLYRGRTVISNNHARNSATYYEHHRNDGWKRCQISPPSAQGRDRTVSSLFLFPLTCSAGRSNWRRQDLTWGTAKKKKVWERERRKKRHAYREGRKVVGGHSEGKKGCSKSQPERCSYNAIFLSWTTIASVFRCKGLLPCMMMSLLCSPLFKKKS